MKIKKIDVSWDGVMYNDTYYFYWFHYLVKDVRYMGLKGFWHDGPHKGFGFWWFSFNWSTPWTKLKEDEYPKL